MKITWPVRACDGRFGEAVEVEYEPHEWEYVREQRPRLDSTDAAERREAQRALLLLHEFKAITGARMLTDEEIATLAMKPLDMADEIETADQTAAAIQTTLIPPEGTDSMFRIPEAARRKLGVVDEPEHEGAEGESDPLPSPDNERIGFFMAPDKAPLPTSRKAAIALYPSSGTKRRQVLDAIARSGERGMIDDEIEALLGMRHTTCSARRKELQNDGWIEHSGRYRKTSASKDAAVWVLTGQGRAQWTPDGRAATA